MILVEVGRTESHLGLLSEGRLFKTLILLVPKHVALHVNLGA